jgi:hypothetical protein
MTSTVTSTMTPTLLNLSAEIRLMNLHTLAKSGNVIVGAQDRACLVRIPVVLPHSLKTKLPACNLPSFADCSTVKIFRYSARKINFALRHRKLRKDFLPRIGSRSIQLLARFGSNSTIMSLRIRRSPPSPRFTRSR